MKRFILTLFIVLESTVQAVGAGGWYVMVPPSDKHMKILDQSSLSQWRILDSADSARDCAIKREPLKEKLLEQSNALDELSIAELQKMDKLGSKIHGSVLDYWMYKLGLKDDPARYAFDVVSSFQKFNSRLSLFLLEEAQDVTCVSVSDRRLRK